LILISTLKVMRANTLIIGYGNVDRQDDGVGWHILKNIAARVGRAIPEEPGSTIEIETTIVDLLYFYQIFPELAHVFQV